MLREDIYKKLEDNGVPGSPSEERALLQRELQNRIEDQDGDTEKERIGRELIREYRSANKERNNEVEIRTDNRALPAEIAERLSRRETDEIIAELYVIVENEGIIRAIDIVDELNNPYIEDDFHRFLVAYIDSRPERINAESVPIRKALGMRLFEIRVSKNTSEVNFSEMISRMQQFLAGMQSLGGSDNNPNQNYFSMEITVPANNSQILFFIGVPVRRADLFEKQILGAFPDIRIIESFNDFNIFAEGGVELVSVAKGDKQNIFPIKTFEDMTHDPIGVVLNSFSELDVNSEGAALQIICAPAGDTFIKKYGMVLDQLKKGKGLKESMIEIASIEKRVLNDLKTTFFAKEDDGDKRIDSDAIDRINKKLSSSIANVNIRIAVSARSLDRTDQILNQIESSFQQYDESRGGRIVFDRPRGAKMKSAISDFIYRIFSEKDSVRLNLAELATIFHLPFQTESATHMLSDNVLVEAPLSFDSPREGIILGKNTYPWSRTICIFSQK